MTSTSRKSHSLASATTLTQTQTAGWIINWSLVSQCGSNLHTFLIASQHSKSASWVPIRQTRKCNKEKKTSGSPQSLSQAVSAFDLVVSREVVRNVGGPYTGARALVSCTRSGFAFKIATSWSAKIKAEKIIIGSANKLQERRTQRNTLIRGDFKSTSRITLFDEMNKW